MEEIIAAFPEALVNLAGDMNTLPVSKLSAKTGLLPIGNQPTRGGNILDQVMVSMPCYSTVRVIRSVVKSDHKAVLVHDSETKMTLTKIKTLRKFRRRSPEQHAASLQHISARNDLFELKDGGVIEEFDAFYTCALELLDRFYPERSVTVSNRDPYYITPQIKYMLREKNRLMRTRNIDAANALALQICAISHDEYIAKLYRTT